MKNRITILLLFSLAAVFASACSILREPEEASAPIEAVPLEIEEAEATAEPAVMEESETSPTSGNLAIFQISQAESEVRFELDEELRGNLITVIGNTDQVAGEIALDLNDLSTTQVGTIQINARTLTTDNNFRNRALNNRILQTGLFEFITFTPTAVNGLPASAGTGEEITFTLEGDLTIRDVTHSVVFDVTATAVSETQLTGSAITTVSREAYDLQIPEVPNVANVEEEVELYIDFTANAS